VAGFGGWFHEVDYRHVDGGAPRSTPGEQDFWVARQEGSGAQTLEWAVQGGNWSAVIMNADGSAHVTSSVSLGGRLNVLLPIGVGLAGVGIILLAIGTVLIVLGARRTRPTAPAAPVLPSGQSPFGQQVGA
jgi:hypothetical protein